MNRKHLKVYRAVIIAKNMNKDAKTLINGKRL